MDIPTKLYKQLLQKLNVCRKNTDEVKGDEIKLLRSMSDDEIGLFLEVEDIAIVADIYKTAQKSSESQKIAVPEIINGLNSLDEKIGMVERLYENMGSRSLKVREVPHELFLDALICTEEMKPLSAIQLGEYCLMEDIYEGSIIGPRNPVINVRFDEENFSNATVRDRSKYELMTEGAVFRDGKFVDIQEDTLIRVRPRTKKILVLSTDENLIADLEPETPRYSLTQIELSKDTNEKIKEIKESPEEYDLVIFHPEMERYVKKFKFNDFEIYDPSKSMEEFLDTHIDPMKRICNKTLNSIVYDMETQDYINELHRRIHKCNQSNMYIEDVTIDRKRTRKQADRSITKKGQYEKLSMNMEIAVNQKKLIHALSEQLKELHFDLAPLQRIAKNLATKESGRYDNCKKNVVYEQMFREVYMVGMMHALKIS